MKKRLIIALSVIAAVAVLGMAVFIATRFSHYTTYAPFSGKVFDISEEEVSMLAIQNGSTGELIEFTDGQARGDVILLLNEFRYKRWMPIPFQTGGWSYRVIIEFTNGERVSCQFDDSFIAVRGVAFTGEANDFGPLIALLSPE